MVPSLLPSALLFLFAPQDSGGSLEQRVNTLEKQLDALQHSTPTKANPNDLRVYWQDGIHLDNAAKDVQLRFGGRFQVDTLFGGSNDFAKSKNVEDGAELRRARLYLQGTVTDLYEFKFQYDFADTNKVKAADVWGEVKKIPAVGNLRVGQFYEPLSFEQNTSDFDADFMDRGAMNSLSPARNIGAALHNGWNNQLVAWLGAFVDDGSGDPSIVQSNGDHAITGRVAGLPYHSDDDSTLIHLGASASYRTPTRNTVQYQARPDSHLAPVFIDTGVLNNVSSVELLDGEFAFQTGAVHGSAEYLVSRLDADKLSDPNFAGYNFAAGWFMTGEHLAYNHVDGVFGAPKINHSLGQDGGFGAVELVARYSNLNLNGGTVRAHEIANTIVGVNWYLCNSIKFAVDGVHSHVQTQGSVNLLELWFQVTF